MGARVLHFCGTVLTRGEASAHLKSAGDAVLIERGRPRLLLLSCPCGCQEEFPINLDPRAGPAWRIYKSHRGGISIFPSIWLESGCKSHYVIWNNQIWLLGTEEDGVELSLQSDEDTLLPDTVLQALSYNEFIPFAEVAESIDAVPWDILTVCRQLVRKGFAHEGRGKKRGYFRRRT